jgi:hypothetical protein
VEGLFIGTEKEGPDADIALACGLDPPGFENLHHLGVETPDVQILACERRGWRG